MYYALVHYLKEYPKEIEQFRKKYDPRFSMVKPHITLVFPIDTPLDQIALMTHIQKMCGHFKPFPVTISGILRSWDDLVFLTADQGKDQLIGLHDDLYTGILSPFLSTTIDFIPHITMGKIEPGNDHILEEAENLNINFTFTLDMLTLINRTTISELSWSKDFELD